MNDMIFNILPKQIYKKNHLQSVMILKNNFICYFHTRQSHYDPNCRHKPTSDTRRSKYYSGFTLPDENIKNMAEILLKNLLSTLET